jgi:hypothetical protein
MAALLRPIGTALILPCGLSAMLAIASPSSATAADGTGAQFEGAEPCVVRHRFEPGPIVGGHNRQPTRAEFEARMQELRALIQRSGGCSSAPPRSSDTAQR